MSAWLLYRSQTLEITNKYKENLLFVRFQILLNVAFENGQYQLFTFIAFCNHSNVVSKDRPTPIRA